MKIRTTVSPLALDPLLSQVPVSWGCQVDSDLPPSPTLSLEQKYPCLPVILRRFYTRRHPVLTCMNGSDAQLIFFSFRSTFSYRVNRV